MSSEEDLVIKIPPADALRVAHELLVAVCWAGFAIVAEQESYNGKRLSVEWRRGAVQAVFRVALDHLPTANPFRAELEDYLERVVIPEVEAKTQRPRLHLV